MHCIAPRRYPRALMIVLPSREAKGFFGAVNRAQREREMNVDVVKEIAAGFGITILAD